ncbi:DUF2970 family protein [Panacagrimonas perspica]|uniref:DUF2970 family protein n=1 Tax=Panacagrimonas perspica TaxID=381431 RepID=A0A4S3KBB6_9GAMM|nr:DUF2970 domain-containing protein [Panacagrimonas perspica]TDU32729.1 DUF2970 family protein [Panacagrimonas perspica]THD05609.1 hypothetical protein B1810_02520 [Panacagrimonas perspica]
MPEVPNPPPRRPTLLQEIGSVLASFFGVQSSRNRKRDFTSGSPLRFLALGIALTATFVLVVFGVVKLVMWKAGL